MDGIMSDPCNHLHVHDSLYMVRTSSRSDLMSLEVYDRHATGEACFGFILSFSRFIFVYFEHSLCATSITNTLSWHKKKRRDIKEERDTRRERRRQREERKKQQKRGEKETAKERRERNSKSERREEKQQRRDERGEATKERRERRSNKGETREEKKQRRDERGEATKERRERRSNKGETRGEETKERREKRSTKHAGLPECRHWHHSGHPVTPDTPDTQDTPHSPCRIRIGSFRTIPVNRTASGIICRRCFSWFAALKVYGNFLLASGPPALFNVCLNFQQLLPRALWQDV